jgi:hypothetical protein
VTLEVDVSFAGFASSYLANGSQLATGHSRFNLSTLSILDAAGLALSSEVSPPSALFVHLHTARCDSTPPGGSHYLLNSSLPDDAASTSSPAQGNNTFSLILRSFTGGVVSAVQPWLVDFDKVLSAVLHDSTGTRQACCNLVPRLPNLPSTYSVTIEANFGLTKGASPHWSPHPL